MEKEKDIEKALVKGIKAAGGIAYKFISPGNVGVPDRLVILPGGGVIFVELKTETGKLSSVQMVQHKRLKDHHQRVTTLYGMHDVERFLSEVRRK